MSPSRTPVKLALDPDRCDRCGRCTDACEAGALKVGAAYIYVDWRSCTSCYDCVKACPRGAITRRESSRQSSASASRAKREAPAKRAEPAKRTRAAEPPVIGSWTLLEAGALLAVVFAAFVAKDAVLNSESVVTMTPSSAVLVRVLMLAAFYAVQIATLAVFVRRRGLTFATAFPIGHIKTSVGSKAASAGLAVALLVGTRVATWIYGTITQALGWNPPELANGNLTDVFGPDAFGLALAVIMVIVVGPFIEEIVFRGVLLDAFESRMPTSVALVAQALLFAFYHFTPWMVFPTFVLGLATGWIARSRESLWPAIALHALYNAVPVGIAFWLVYSG